MANGSTWLVEAAIVIVTVGLTITQRGCSPFKNPHRFMREAKVTAIDITIFVSLVAVLTSIVIKEVGSLA
jgi:hypothetical protein